VPTQPTERAVELARLVLIASGDDTRLAQPSDATMAEAMRALSKALPSAKPEWRPVMEQVVRDEVRAYGEHLFDGNVDIYARRFTEPQLTDMLAFYRSPAGQALASQSAAITRDRLALARKYNAELLPHMVAAVCAKYTCPPPAAANPSAPTPTAPTAPR
jgi:hypothetical protein